MSVSPWLEENVIQRLQANLRVLMVEGEDDKNVYEPWLDKLAGGPGSGRVPNVVSANGKGKVLQHLRALKPEAEQGRVCGIVDRDEWDKDDCVKWTQEVPGLRVVFSRHCLESYFCHPNDLAAALAASPVPDGDRAVKAIKSATRVGVDDWVDHWSLWATIERLKNRMGEAAYPNAFHRGLKAPKAMDIKAKLQEWEAMIDVDTIMEDYRALRKKSLRLDGGEQLRAAIYAKNVYPQIVLVELNKLKTSIESNEWLGQLAAWFPEVPADIAEILKTMVI